MGRPKETLSSMYVARSSRGMSIVHHGLEIATVLACSRAT